MCDLDFPFDKHFLDSAYTASTYIIYSDNRGIRVGILSIPQIPIVIRIYYTS